MLCKCHGLCLRELFLHSVHPYTNDYSHNHISGLLKQTIHQSKQTPLHIYLPSTQLFSVPIIHLFAHKFIVRYGPQISEQQFLKCVTPEYRLRVVETFVFFTISRCVVFIVARRRFGTSYGAIFMSQISSKNTGQLVDR